MNVIEVVARIGESTIDFVHLPQDRSYVVGNTPGVDLAVPGIGRFPLVDGDLVRIPAGVPATAGGQPVAAGARRAGAEPVELELGLATIAVRLIERARVPVARPRFEWRVAIYVLVSLAAQLALWAAAVTVRPVHDPVPRSVRRPVHVMHPQPLPKPEPRPEPKPKAQAKAQTKPHGPMRRAEHAGHAARAVEDTEDGFAAVARFAKNWKDPVIELDGTGTDADSYTENDFGNSKHFDPDTDLRYNSVKAAKAWDLPDAGKQLGQTLPPPKMEWCDDDSCLARGPIALAAFLNELERHRAEISACYVDHTDHSAGTVRLRFEISPEGKAHASRQQLVGDQVTVVDGGTLGVGIGTVGRCVAKILDGVRWPQRTEATEVWIGIRFWQA